MNLNSRKTKTAIAFGTVLCELRRKRKLSQEKLAFRCGVARHYIALLEAGDRHPSLEIMLTLSQILQIPVGHLATHLDEKLEEIPAE